MKSGGTANSPGRRPSSRRSESSAQPTVRRDDASCATRRSDVSSDDASDGACSRPPTRQCSPLYATRHRARAAGSPPSGGGGIVGSPSASRGIVGGVKYEAAAAAAAAAAASSPSFVRKKHWPRSDATSGRSAIVGSPRTRPSSVVL